MSVALPPPLPPEQAPIAEVRQAREGETIRFQTYRVHVLGVNLPELGDASTIVANAETLSNAVRTLADAYYDAGYPGSQLRYALDGDDLYVLVINDPLVDVRAPPELAPYFDGLPLGEPLRDGVFEPGRALADAHAQRIGLNAQMQLTPVVGGRALDFETARTDIDRTRIGFAFSNPGNRFVGRHFLDLDLAHVLDSGDRFGLLWSVGLSELNDEARADEYYDEELSWSRVTPAGLFGLSVHVVDYKSPVQSAEQPLQTTTLDGDLEEYAAMWSYPVVATFASRWIADVQVDFTNKRREAQDETRPRQDDQYPSMQAGLVFTHSTVWLQRDWDLEAGLGLRKGMSNEVTEEGADLAYLAWLPRARADVVWSERLTVGIAAIGQFTADSVPEQSQWVLGGTDALHAWLPGVAVGDSGALALLQVGYRLDAINKFELRPRVFAEYGFSDYRTPPPGAPADRIGLADIGAELTARYASWIEASLAGAIPILDDDLDGAERDRSHAGLLFRVAVTF